MFVNHKKSLRLKRFAIILTFLGFLVSIAAFASRFAGGIFLMGGISMISMAAILFALYPVMKNAESELAAKGDAEYQLLPKVPKNKKL